MQYEILMFWDDGAHMWGVQVPDLPGCSAQGTSVAQAERAAAQAIESYIFGLKSNHRRVPPPTGHLLKAVDVDLNAVPERSTPEPAVLRESFQVSRGDLIPTSAFVQGTLEGFGLPDPLPLNLKSGEAVDTVA